MMGKYQYFQALYHNQKAFLVDIKIMFMLAQSLSKHYFNLLGKLIAFRY